MTTFRLPAAGQPSDHAYHRPTTFLLLALATLLAYSVQTAHASHMDRVGLIEQTWDGVAIKGYDPVAYFELARAAKGSSEFRHEWLGQEWHFVSARHRDMFAADPVKYVPQFGGYCSETHSVTDIDPTAWRIVGSRLYLFFSETSARKFAQDRSAQSKAASNWRNVKDGLSQ